MLSPRDPPQSERYTETKVKTWRKIFHANGKGKKAWVAILISDKMHFKMKTIVRDRE